MLFLIYLILLKKKLMEEDLMLKLGKKLYHRGLKDIKIYKKLYQLKRKNKFKYKSFIKILFVIIHRLGKNNF